MNKSLIIFILLMWICISMAQVQDEPLFGSFDSPASLDTVNAVSDTLYSRPIIFADLNNMEGSLSISGYIKTLTGADTSFSCELRMITDVSSGQYKYDIWRPIGSISLTDSTNFFFNVSDQSWWSVCHGYQVRFIPAALNGTYLIKARGLSK